jgi:hypothetical protein
MRSLLLPLLACAAIVRAQEPFAVSLSRTHAFDLSPYYRQVVDEAAACYIGDFPLGTSMMGRDCPVPFDPHQTIDTILGRPFESVSLYSDHLTNRSSQPLTGE